MPWLRISFDGEGLAYARMTRHDKAGTVYLLPGSPVESRQGAVYPTMARLVGFTKVHVDDMVAVLRRQYGNAVTGPDHATIVVDMPARRLWADALTNLRQLEHLFGTPYVRIDRGFVTVVLRSQSDRPAAWLQGRLQAAARNADVDVLEEFDTGPWDGLRPRLLASVI